MYQLTVQHGSAKGVVWPIEDGVNLLGRSEDCGIVISGDGAVSRIQCEIIRDGESLTIRQLSDRSLSLVNGAVVREGPLREGDTLTVGLTPLLVGRVPSGTLDETAPRTSPPKTTRILVESEAEYLTTKSDDSRINHPIKSLRDLIALFQLSYAFNETSNVGDLEKQVLEAIRVRLNPSAAWVVRFPEGVGVPRSVWRSGVSSLEEEEYAMALIRESVQQNQSVLTPEWIDTPQGSQLRSYMTVPLFVGGATMGGIALLTQSPHGVYDEADLQFAVALGRILASSMMSIENRERLELEVERLRASRATMGQLLGTSRAMARVRAQLAQAAASPLSVLILGESGTGKELAARYIHDHSQHREGPYVPVNCAAIPTDLVESELFGYEKGAFTGATSRRIGLVEQVRDGTLFLDEIGDLSMENQSRFLRVLENGTFRRVGGSEEVQVSFRLVAATNKDLPDLVGAGLFRDDLYHRINGFEIIIPPLRERPSDIPVLAEHFLGLAQAHAPRRLLGIQPEAIEWLRNRPWKGNARELKNAIDRAVHVADGETLSTDDFSHTHSPVPETESSEFLTIAEAEKKHITQVLEALDRDVPQAANVLGVSRSTLYSKIKKFRISP